MHAGRPPRRRARDAAAGGYGDARAALVRRRRAVLAAALAALAALAVVLLGGGGSHAHGHPAPASRATVTQGGAPGTRAAGGLPGAEPSRVRSLVTLGKPIYCGARRGNEVALTFDDGPGPYTRLVLAKLRKHHIHATFFDVARNIPLLPGALAQEAAIGGLGDHTITHPLLTALSSGEADAQIAGAQSALERSSGAPVFLFRPPYGGRSENIDAIARAHGLLEIMWTVDSADALGANYAQIERNVIGGLRGGAIILMHENHGQTVRALLGIFAAIARLHVHTVGLAQLLADDPPSPAQVRAGGAGCGAGAGLGAGG